MIQELYRPAEVQAILKIKHSTFWRLVKDGKIETRKLGRATVIPADSIKQFIEGLPLSK